MFVPYCPVQVPTPEQGPAPQFWQFCVLWGPPCNHPPCKISAWWLESSQSRRLFRWVSGATTCEFFYINSHWAFGKKFCILLSCAHAVCHFVKQKFIVLLSAEASSESKCMKYLSVKSCHMSVNGWPWSQSFCCGCDQREAVMGHILNISFVGTSKRLDHLEGHPRAVHISLTPIFHSQPHHAMHKNHWLETIGSLFAQKNVSSTNISCYALTGANTCPSRLFLPPSWSPPPSVSTSESFHDTACRTMEKQHASVISTSIQSRGTHWPHV